MDRFSTSFSNGRDIRSPWKVEKLTLLPRDCSHFLRLDNIDAIRLIDIRIGKVLIDPEQWISLIERATHLCCIELSFSACTGVCDPRRLQANKKLLASLAAREHLSTIKFAPRCSNYSLECKCMRIESEFIQMLKTIGARGRLTKFALDEFFEPSPHNIDLDRVFTTICAYIPSLRSIKFTPISADVVASSIVHLRELEEVDFTDAELGLAPKIVPPIAQLPHLKRLGLCFTRIGINDEAMSMMECLANATKLVELRIGGISWISDDVLEKCSNTIAPNLQVLMLDGGLDFDGLETLLEKTVRLRTLILDGRTCITEEILSIVAQSCPQLELLGITDEEEFDDEDSDESEITVESVQQIIDNCPKLRRLGGISDEIWNSLHIPRGRKIVNDVDTMFLRHGLDSSEYN